MAHLTLRTPYYLFFWTGKDWSQEGTRARTWKTRRGAEGQIERLRRRGLLGPDQIVEVVED